MIQILLKRMENNKLIQLIWNLKLVMCLIMSTFIPNFVSIITKSLPPQLRKKKTHFNFRPISWPSELKRGSWTAPTRAQNWTLLRNCWGSNFAGIETKFGIKVDTTKHIIGYKFPINRLICHFLMNFFRFFQKFFFGNS